MKMAVIPARMGAQCKPKCQVPAFAVTGLIQGLIERDI